MSITESIDIAFEILILLLLLHMTFFKSYFTEKGKNLATKEDVQEITSLVETVKSQLQFSLQGKLSLRAEEHQTIVDYFAKYSMWLSTIMNINTAGITKDNFSQLAGIRSRLRSFEQDFELASGKMELFVENVEIHAQHAELFIETLKLQNHADEMTFELEGIYLKMKQMEPQTPVDKQRGLYDDVLKQIVQLNAVHLKERAEKYRVLLPLVHKQRRAISMHIRALVDL